MTGDYRAFEEHRVKHLEMIQAVIARLGGNGFLIKGWAITLASAFVGLAVHSEDCSFAWVGTASSLTFWGLDAYFLRAERRFRMLGDRVRRLDQKIEPFFMGATSKTFLDECDQAQKWKLSWGGSATSWTLSIFYGTLIAGTLISSLLI